MLCIIFLLIALFAVLVVLSSKFGCSPEEDNIIRGLNSVDQAEVERAMKKI